MKRKTPSGQQSTPIPNGKRDLIILGVIAVATVSVVVAVQLDMRADRAASDKHFQAQREAYLEDPEAFIEELTSPPPTPTLEPLPISDTWMKPVFFDENTLAVFNVATNEGAYSQGRINGDSNSSMSPCAPHDELLFVGAQCEPVHLGIICLGDTIHSIIWAGGDKIDSGYFKPLRAPRNTFNSIHDHDSWALDWYERLNFRLFDDRIGAPNTLESIWKIWHTFVGADNEFLIGHSINVGGFEGVFSSFLRRDVHKGLYMTGDFGGFFELGGVREATQPVVDWCKYRTPVDADPIREDWLYEYDGPFAARYDTVSADGAVKTLVIIYVSDQNAVTCGNAGSGNVSLLSV